jgi:hypothetical protein
MCASQWFPISHNGQYRIPLGVQHASGGMAQINIIFDTGNDITLFTTATSHQLGYDPHSMGDSFPVTGITPNPLKFGKLNITIRIGGLRPIMIPCGLATEEQFPEDLMGRKGLMDSGAYSVTQDERGITFTEKQGPVAMLANSGSRISGKLRNAMSFSGFGTTW